MNKNWACLFRRVARAVQQRELVPPRAISSTLYTNPKVSRLLRISCSVAFANGTVESLGEGGRRHG